MKGYVMNNNINHTSKTKSKKANKRRFNFIDLLIVILVLAIVAVAIYAFSPWSKLQELWSIDNTNIQYVVEITGVDSNLLNKIKEGDKVIDSVTKNELGTVVDIDHNTKYSELSYIKQEDGSITPVLAEHPDKHNIIITISAEASHDSAKGYHVNSCRIAVGEQLFLRFPDYTCNGYCIGLDVQS